MRILVVNNHRVAMVGIVAAIETLSARGHTYQFYNYDDAMELVGSRIPLDAAICQIQAEGDIDGLTAISKAKIPCVALVHSDISLARGAILGSAVLALWWQGVTPAIIKDAVAAVISPVIAQNAQVVEDVLRHQAQLALKSIGVLDALPASRFDVLQLLGNGYDVKEVALRLEMTNNTVYRAIADLKLSTGCDSILALAIFARQAGLHIM
uniref:HTH luxR-type domain-containing protein n=1 Tax=viral metagenome TaxID=1070528 RepID=A0A6M3LK11_9ZZZZ